MKTINEYLIDLLLSTRLYEMAESQKECEGKVQYQTINILENLVLILYFGISNFHTTNIDHWKSELITAILNASNFSPKKDKSRARRVRIVKRVFEREDMYDYDQIYHKVHVKIYDEKETRWPEDKDSKYYLDQAILGAIMRMDDIIDLIVGNDLIVIREWVRKL